MDRTLTSNANRVCRVQWTSGVTDSIVLWDTTLVGSGYEKGRSKRGNFPGLKYSLNILRVSHYEIGQK